jgi:hypothetical protein
VTRLQRVHIGDLALRVKIGARKAAWSAIIVRITELLPRSTSMPADLRLPVRTTSRPV